MIGHNENTVGCSCPHITIFVNRKRAHFCIGIIGEGTHAVLTVQEDRLTV